MKKFRAFFLLGSSLSLFVQSYSRTWEENYYGVHSNMTDELHSQPLSKNIIYTLRHVLRANGLTDDLGSGAKYQIPVHALGQKTVGYIRFSRTDGKEKFNYTLPYKHCNYDDLEEYEKKIFNHFRFNNNGDYVTVIGLYDIAAPKLYTQPGSISIREQVELLTWKKETYWNGLFQKDRQKIQTCPGVKHEFAVGLYIQ